MYCSKCGFQLDDETQVCSACGCPTENYNSNTSSRELNNKGAEIIPRKISKNYIIILAVCLLTIVIGAVVMMPSKDYREASTRIDEMERWMRGSVDALSMGYKSTHDEFMDQYDNTKQEYDLYYEKCSDKEQLKLTLKIKAKILPLLDEWSSLYL